MALQRAAGTEDTSRRLPMRTIPYSGLASLLSVLSVCVLSTCSLGDLTGSSDLVSAAFTLSGDTVVVVGAVRKLVPTIAAGAEAGPLRIQWTSSDGAGDLLVPGFWHTHVHSAGTVGWHFPLFLAQGITSVRNMHGTAAHPLELVKSIKPRLASGELLGPRMIANGGVVDGDPPICLGSVVVHVPPAMPADIGSRSRAPRVLDERIENGRYVAALEGLAGQTYTFRVLTPTAATAAGLVLQTGEGATAVIGAAAAPEERSVRITFPREGANADGYTLTTLSGAGR